MAKSTSEKEKEILQYIEDISKKENWISLTYGEIVEKFEDSEFDEKLIENILKKLEENDRIVLKEVNFEFYSTKRLSKEVNEKLAPHLTSEKNLLSILSFFIWAILLTNDYILNLVFNFAFTNEFGEITSNYWILVSGFVVGLVCVLVIRKIVMWLYDSIKDRFPIVKEYIWIAYPYIIFFMLGFLINYFWDISMDVIWGAAVAGGSAIVGVIYYIKRDKK